MLARLTRRLPETVRAVVAFSAIPRIFPFFPSLLPCRWSFGHILLWFYHIYATERRDTFRLFFLPSACAIWTGEIQEASCSPGPSISHRAFWATYELVTYDRMIWRNYTNRSVPLPGIFEPPWKHSQDNILARDRRLGTTYSFRHAVLASFVSLMYYTWRRISYHKNDFPRCMEHNLLLMASFS